MEIKTSDSYQKEVLKKYKENKGGAMMSGYLINPTRSSIRGACLWLLGRRKEKNDEYILNHFFQFKEGEDKARHIQGLKSEKADKFVPIINFLKERVQKTSSENIELISWLIDFRPRPLQEYLNTNDSHIEEEIFQIKKSDIDSGKKEVERKKLEETKKKEEKKRRRRIITISISIAFGMMLLFLGIQNWPLNILKNNPKEIECMTWADSLYVKVSCDKGPFSQYGTKVDTLDQMKLKKMRKVEVDAAYPFFDDNGNPLIWYYKKSSTEIEYFTAPGLHPLTNETLKKITPYIIQTYVPFHNKRTKQPQPITKELIKTKNQLLNNILLKDSSTKKLSLFILDNKHLLDKKATNEVKNYLKKKGYHITAPLVASDKINQEIISNLKSLNSEFFQAEIHNYTQLLCIGEVETQYKQSSNDVDLILCQLALTFSIISTIDGSEIDSFSKTITGRGFNRVASTTNAYKKMFL